MNIVTHVLAFMAGGAVGIVALALLIVGGDTDGR